MREWIVSLLAALQLNLCRVVGGCTMFSALIVPSLAVQAEHLVLLHAIPAIEATAESELKQSELKLLQKVMASYGDSYRVEGDVSRKRAIEILAQDQPACIPMMLKTPEREARMSFSQPYMIEEGLRLVVLSGSPWQQKLDELQKAGPISLQQLLSMDKGPIIGIDSNRSFGVKADELLQRHAGHRAIYIRTSALQYLDTMEPMLDKKYVDIMIEYGKVAKRTPLKLSVYPFAEADSFVMSYFSCALTEKGQSFVAALNRAIAKSIDKSDYQQLMFEEIAPNLRPQAKQIWRRATK
jgi:uncharacterized protein (TIGR02285 family)